MPDAYPVSFAVDYPDRPLSRLTTFFRLLTMIPIAIVLALLIGVSVTTHAGEATTTTVLGGTGLLFLPPLLMLVFRHKYPRWWFDWNLELLRFINRVGIYVALMDDRYPSTDEHGPVKLDFHYPDARTELNRWLPLVKWLLVIPHLIVLALLHIGSAIAIVISWFAILVTGHYPRPLFGFVEGVLRWHNRVTAYAVLLVTDRYPPFSLGEQRGTEPRPHAAAPA